MSKHFSAEEKATLIKRILAGETLIRVSKEAGISRTILYKWINTYKENNQATLITLMRHLSPRIKHGRTHYKAVPIVKEREIIKVALKNPSFSLRKIASLVYCSRHCVWTVLKEYNLNMPQLREIHLNTIGKRLKLPIDASMKLSIMRRLEEGEQVSAICREFRVSRTIVYKWVRRYTQASGEMRQAALAGGRPKAEKHYRYVSEARQLVLDIVLASPHLSIRKIQQELVKRAGKCALSRHGVHSILRAYNLNSYEKRKLFAASQKQANDANSL